MARNLPVAFGLLLAGGLLIDKGAQAVSGAFSNGTAPGGITTGPAPSSQTMASYRDALTARGLTKVAAAGVVGNIWQESSGDPNAPGGGLAQWIGSRWQALVSMAKTASPSASQQLDFLVSELKSGSQGLTLAELNQAATPTQAATLFSQKYERPGNPMLANRIIYADQAFKA